MSSDQAYFGSEKVLRMNPSVTTTGPGTLWGPTIAGEKVVLKGVALRARVTVTLAGVTPGEGIYLCDGTNAIPLLVLATFRTATDAAGTDYGMVYAEFPGGYTLTNPLRLQVSGGALTSGTITVTGLVWGDESL
jgi:hypothetical protein